MIPKINQLESRTLTEARRLLAECKELRQNEQTYKRECRVEMNAIEAEIEKLRLQSEGQSTKENVALGNSILIGWRKENFLHDLLWLINVLEYPQQLHQLAEQLSTLNREIFYLTRQIDSKPTQIELNQYQRRFVELYNQGCCYLECLLISVV